jgi:hypothetical protein
MSEGRLVFLIIAGIIGLFITPGKLYHAMVATGRLPGRQLVPGVVLGKSQSAGSRGFTYYDLQYAVDTPNGRVEKTDQLEYDAWVAASEGSTIQVIRAGGQYHHPGSVYISPGNFAFDWFLLFAEIGCVVIAGVWLWRSAQPVSASMKKGPPPQRRRW